MLHNEQKVYSMVIELDEITRELVKDANLHRVAMNSLNKETALAYSRQYIRAAFVVIEAVIFATKQLAMEIADQLNRLEPKDVVMLTETTYTLAENGAIKEKRLDIPVASNTRYIFTYLPDLVGDSCKIDFGKCKEWDDFKNAKDVRNRLTHPKTIADTQLTEDECRRVLGAIDWWFVKHGEMMTSVGESFKEKSEE